ncbi:MAG: YdjY domain-containing protein [Verrucomicrobiales bacterium]
MKRGLALGLMVAAMWQIAYAAVGPQPNPNGKPGPTATNLVVKAVSTNELHIGGVILNRATRTLEIPAFVNMTEGLMEYFLVTDYGKVHESVLFTTNRPYAIHAAALLLTPKGSDLQKNPAPIELTLLWLKDGKTNETTVASCVLNLQTKKEMVAGPWSYSGSQMIDGVYLAEREGSVISIIEDQSSVITNPRKGRENDEIWQPNSKKLPEPETSVTVRIKFLESSKHEKKSPEK